MNFCIYL